MSIFAISDLHLSFTKKVVLADEQAMTAAIAKPMDIFGWGKHYLKLKENWLRVVTEKDTVLMPGDTSWALRLEQAMCDFDWIAQLPGKKVISPGNHCYFARSKKKIRDALPKSIEWLDAEATLVEEKVVVATRGWISPKEPGFQEERDLAIYKRQAGRLELALEHAVACYPEKERIAMLHFPPITKTTSTSLFMDLLIFYKVKICVYGHLHGQATQNAVERNINGVSLKLVSCDALNFTPVLLT